jgi:hypothetical protein
MIKQISWFIHQYFKYYYEVLIYSLNNKNIILNKNYFKIYKSLNFNGAYKGSLDNLENVYTYSMLETATRLMSHVDLMNKPNNFFKIQIENELMNDYPEIIKWGLDEKLIDLITKYIGTDIKYRGVAFRRDFPGGREDETRLWHYDDEDLSIIKVIVYLNDVDSKSGPFEYIKKSLSTCKIFKNKKNLRFTDQDIVKFSQSCNVVSCTGNAGTVIIGDTAKILHRGLIGKSTPRNALFYAYNRVNPINPAYCKPLFDSIVFLNNNKNLTIKQRNLILN